jgi:hypothetical protein
LVPYRYQLGLTIDTLRYDTPLNICKIALFDVLLGQQLPMDVESSHQLQLERTLESVFGNMDNLRPTEALTKANDFTLRINTNVHGRKRRRLSLNQSHPIPTKTTSSPIN